MSLKALEPGSRLGKYEVQEHIATGGMGAVYRAVDLELRRAVALKVLPPELAQREAVLERFRREARSSARLSHKHIVTLFECGYDAERDLHYLALEYVDGEDLADYLDRRGRLPPEEARRILVQAAKALDHAFEQGVVHRDIKPSNFLMARVGNKLVVKLTDLGLALTEHDDDFKVTRDGSTVGTVDYMAPEQARDSRSVDTRSDIYSLGCTAYQMLAGKPPFADGGLGERVLKHQMDEPPDVRRFNPAVSEAFWAVLKKMLAKRPDDRYATPAELLADLKRTPAEGAAEMEGVSDAPTPPPLPPTRRTHLPRPAPEPESPALPSSSGELVPPEGALPRRPTPPSSTEEGLPLVTPEQARAAAAYHERAVEVLAEGGGEDYARQLLLNCLKLDPFNRAYRKTLRDINRKASAGLFGRVFGSLNVMATKTRLRAARAARDWRKVLELGEEVLARQPADAETHVDLATAAQELKLPDLALWLLEQGREMAPDSPLPLRALARFHEERKDWKRAIAFWERVRQLEPKAADVQRKIDDLAVRDHISRNKRRG